MKKTLFIFILSLFVSVEIILASDISVNGIYYDFNDTYLTATVTYRGSSASYYSNEYSGDVTIPETVTYGSKTYSVTSIGTSAFNKCSGLTSVTIPNSVTSIGANAFYECSGLTSVTIPNSVTSIGSSAFYECSSLTSVTIPNSITSIGYSAFYNCSGLTSIDIPNSLTTIPNRAFYGCTKLKSLTIPDGVTSIEYSAFEGCSSLTSVDLPNSLTSIGSKAFYGCQLTSIVIPENVETTGVSAFYFSSGKVRVIWNAKNCTSDCRFYQGTIYSSPTTSNNPFGYIDESYYTRGMSFSSFIFGDKVESIPAGLFNKMTVDTLVFSNSITSIGKNAFYGETDENCNYNISNIKYIYSKALNPISLKGYTGTFVCSIPCGTLTAYLSVWGNICNQFIEHPKYEIAVSSSNASYGVAKLVSQPDCESAILTAIPNEGCKFVKWSDGNTQATRYLELTGDVSLTAEFVKEGYTIHVNQDCSSTIE